MSPESAALLTAFWSWVDGVLTVVLLGVLLPASLGMLLGFVPLMRQRRDARPAQQLAVIAVLLAAAGAFTLGVLGEGEPLREFWGWLSAEIGILVLLLTAFTTFRASSQRARRDREAIDAVRTFVPEHRGMTEGQRPAPRPTLRAVEAEYWMAEWMRWLGAVDSVVTAERRDGGVDVRSAHYVAQVTHRPQDFVSVDVVRALHGVAAVEGRAGIVFASGRYSSDALSFASRSGVALFIFRPAQGQLIAANAIAQRLLNDGLRAGVPLRA